MTRLELMKELITQFEIMRYNIDRKRSYMTCDADMEYVDSYNGIQFHYYSSMLIVQFTDQNDYRQKEFENSIIIKFKKDVNKEISSWFFGPYEIGMALAALNLYKTLCGLITDSGQTDKEMANDIVTESIHLNYQRPIENVLNMYPDMFTEQEIMKLLEYANQEDAVECAVVILRFKKEKCGFPDYDPLMFQF